MRIVFIGTVEFSLLALEHLIGAGAHISGVCTRQASPFNADFADLEPVCRQNEIPCLKVDDINSLDALNWIRERSPDVIFCFGWSYLLNGDLLALPPIGVLGYHPTALPANRGRHPIIWALALGLPKTASTFFFMDEGADSGDIVSQYEIDIAPDDDAATLYAKMTATALNQLSELVPAMQEGRHQRLKQPVQLANYWRKRGHADGQIDWRMSARAIYNLVRALTKPYVGAEFRQQGQPIKVWKVAIVDDVPSNIEPGKVLKTDNGQALVKCGEGAVLLLDASPDFIVRVGEYL